MQAVARMRTVALSGVVCAALVLIATPSGALQRLPARDPFATAVQQFRAGNFREAADTFAETAELEPSYAAPALLWSAKALIAADQLSAAEARLERVRSEHPGTEPAAEALYQLGRVAYIDEKYGRALGYFSRFVDVYPSSPFVGNAYYWAGESLLSLGHLDEAETMFATVVERFPDSYRTANAESRLDLMQLRRRDAYFRRLLRWSHEEQLSLIEELDRRDQALREAVDDYRIRLLEQAPSEYRAQLLDLEQQRRALEQRLQQREQRIAELEQEVYELRDAQAAPETTVRAYRRRFEVLELKAEALELRRQLLDRLLEQERRRPGGAE